MNEPATVRVAHGDERPPREAAFYWLALGTFAIGTPAAEKVAPCPNI